MSASGRARAEDLGQVLVDRVAGDAEQPGDRGNGVLGPGEEVAGVTDLLGGHGRWPAEAGTAGACGVEAFASTRPRPGLGSAGRGSGPLWTPARTRSGRRSERLVRARAGQLRPGVRPPVDGTEKGHPKFLDTRTSRHRFSNMVTMASARNPTSRRSCSCNARLLGVSRNTIYKYLPEISSARALPDADIPAQTAPAP